MNDRGMNGEMHMNDYSLMGGNMYWWILLLVFILIVLLAMQKYRKRK